jgi:hypothetical protein
MVLVAVAMVAIIGMATLSIDVITLYLAKEEAQRSADQAALAAAKILSLSGITGDPANTSGNWGRICGPDDGNNGVAARAAKSVAALNAIAGRAPTTVTVTYTAGTPGGGISSTSDCQTLATSAFGVNPMVTVQLTRANLPSFFSRLWGSTSNSVSATATAEAFNPSNSGTVGNQTTGTITPVQPRCVKPWVVPNRNPLIPGQNGNGTWCDNQDPITHTTTPCNKIVNTTNGSITNPGISLNGSATSGVIGETFWLVADCMNRPTNCTTRTLPPQANYIDSGGLGNTQPPANLLYIPNQVGSAVVAVPSCNTGDPYNEAIVGCDHPTNYSCGVQNANMVDLTINPANATSDGVQCLTHQSNLSDLIEPTGQDYLNYVGNFGGPSSYPFQILAGSASPLVATGLTAGTPISSSPSIVSLPIYDDAANPPIATNTTTNLTFVGFLQVFINAVDNKGNVNVTVLNVAGCSNGSGPTVGTAITGNSPVPVRLITPP